MPDYGTYPSSRTEHAQMRSQAFDALTFVVVLAGALAFRAAPSTARQFSDPACGSVAMCGGAVRSGFAVLRASPCRSAVASSSEGGIVTLHDHPGALVIYVESGALTYTACEDEALVTRLQRRAPQRPPSGSDQATPHSCVPADVVYEEGVVHVTDKPDCRASGHLVRGADLGRRAADAVPRGDGATVDGTSGAGLAEPIRARRRSSLMRKPSCPRPRFGHGARPACLTASSLSSHSRSQPWTSIVLMPSPSP